MGFFNKLKDVLFEDDDDEVIKEEKNKEVKKEEVKEESIEEPKIDTDSAITERDLFKTDPKFKFPINFDDEDFVEEDNEQVNVLNEQEEKSRVIEHMSPPDDKRVFRPSPVISPIYGILDKNYKKGDIVEKNSASGFDIDGKIDVDSVMRKAYGQVEVTKTVTREEKFYTTEETPIEKEAEINLFESLKEEKEVELPKKEEQKDEKPLSRLELNEEDYEEESYDLDEIDDKIKSIDKLLKETSDDDFYSLVDSMYKDEESEE